MELILLQAGGAAMAQMLMFGAIILIMYFFMIRPQMKKAKEQQEFIANLGKGDKIVTAGGIYGKIIEVEEKTFVIKVDNNARLRVDKSFISLDSTKGAELIAE